MCCYCYVRWSCSWLTVTHVFEPIVAVMVSIHLIEDLTLFWQPKNNVHFQRFVLLPQIHEWSLTILACRITLVVLLPILIFSLFWPFTILSAIFANTVVQSHQVFKLLPYSLSRFCLHMRKMNIPYGGSVYLRPQSDIFAFVAELPNALNLYFLPTVSMSVKCGPI